VIVDEFGKGTSETDGMALMASVISEFLTTGEVIDVNTTECLVAVGCREVACS